MKSIFYSSFIKGYLMDMKVLQECVQENVGDLTFEVKKKKKKKVQMIMGPSILK
jgi:TAG lipase/lysophosphatidylethanolamine acyltransferase